MFSRARYCVVFFVGLLAISSTAWTAEPATIPAEQKKETPAERIERLLDATVDIDFEEDAWLSDVLKFLEKHGITAKFDEMVNQPTASSRCVKGIVG